MLDWLTENFELFGMPAQNWMLLLGVGVLVYAAVLIIGRNKQPSIF